MYQGVLATCIAVAGVWMSSLLSLKSMSTALRAELKRILPGLMSLCVTLFLWTKAMAETMSPRMRRALVGVPEK